MVIDTRLETERILEYLVSAVPSSAGRSWWFWICRLFTYVPDEERSEYVFKKFTLVPA